MDEAITTLARYLLPVLCIIIVGYSMHHLLKSKAPKVTPACFYDEQTGDEYIITRWETSIGRSNSCDIVLENRTVSRFHAVIVKQKKGWVITDTHSASGTTINRKKITEPTVIQDGQTVKFGKVSLVFRIK